MTEFQYAVQILDGSGDPFLTKVTADLSEAERTAERFASVTGATALVVRREVLYSGWSVHPTGESSDADQDQEAVQEEAVPADL